MTTATPGLVSTRVAPRTRPPRATADVEMRTVTLPQDARILEAPTVIRLTVGAR